MRRSDKTGFSRGTRPPSRGSPWRPRPSISPPTHVKASETFLKNAVRVYALGVALDECLAEERLPQALLG